MAMAETQSSCDAADDEAGGVQRIVEHERRSREDQDDRREREALERRVRDLEMRARLAEAERDELARACSAARAAQVAVEDEMRAREDILAVVAHDLRNPLGTIVMGASTLRHMSGPADPSAQRV